MIAERLLAWFRANARELPWRTDRSPYRVWISEAMLQQTRVETVLRYYDRFLAHFPDVESLAAAPEDSLMKAWEGLGYYRRARMLQAAAREIIARPSGKIPGTAGELRALPGFGPYTAGAVASLAFGERVAAVDGNVLRVWARVTGSQDDISRPASRAAAEGWVLAEQPRDAPGAFNEALMELGATVCTPTNPHCGTCPLAASCVARAEGSQDALPVKARKVPSRTMRVTLALTRRGDLMLLEKREAGLLAGTWGLPWVEGGAEELTEKVASLTSGSAKVGAVVARGRHVFTHRVWEMELREVESSGAAGEWRAPESVALGSAHRKLLAQLT